MEIPASEGKTIEVAEVQTLPGGDFILFGNYKAGLPEGFIIRMSNSGAFVNQNKLSVNGKPVTVHYGKVLLSGDILVTGVVNDGTNAVFIALLQNDLSVKWIKTFIIPASPLKVSLDLILNSAIALSIQLNDSILYSRLTLDGNVVWMKQVMIVGLEDLVGFSNLNFSSVGLVANCMRNGKHTTEVMEVSQGSGDITDSHTLDDGNEENHSFDITEFNIRLNILGVVKTPSGFEIVRNNLYSSAGAETKHNYKLAGTVDFGVTGAMDNAADALGICLPTDGKLLFIRHFSYYQTPPEFTKEYNVPVGSKLKAVARSFDGGFLFALNTADQDRLILLKTDSSGVLSGCGYTSIANDYEEKISKDFFTSQEVSSTLKLQESPASISNIALTLASEFKCKQDYCPPKTPEDTCLSSYYKVFRSHSYIDAFNEYFLMRGNKHLVSTFHADRILGNGNQTKSTLKTFTEKGDFINSMSVYLDGIPSNYFIRQVTDSTVMMVSYSSKDGKARFTFTLVNDELKIVWSKSVETTNYEFNAAGIWDSNDLHRDKEGNYYFSGVRMGFMQNPGILVYKMNAVGDPLWLKAYQYINNGYSGPVRLVSTSSSLIAIIEGSPASVTVRLDKISGQMLNGFQYQNRYNGSTYSRLARFDNGRIYYCGNDENDRFAMATFDTLGRPTRFRAIQNSSIIRAGNVLNGMLYATYLYYNGSQYKNVILKADSNLNVVYINEYDPVRYSYASGLGVSAEGNIYVGGNYSYGGNNGNYTDANLIKYTNKGELGTCPYTQCNSPINDIDLQTLPLTFSALPQVNFQPVDLLQELKPDNDGLIVAATLCSSVTTCNFIKLSGDSTFCQPSLDYKIQITKTIGCTIMPQWFVDTSFVTIGITNDTTAFFKFKKPGLTWIRATLNTGCNLYMDSLQVHVFITPTTLNLGRDTVICEGNTFLLSPGNGFYTYAWQDGTTDSSLLVNGPGTYTVEVGIGCNKTLRDSIIIAPHPPISFRPLTDRVKCNQDTVVLKADDGFISYSWSPSYQTTSTTNQTLIVKPLIDTAYYLVAEKKPGCFIYDTIQIKVHTSPSIFLGKDTSFCLGESIGLNAGEGFANYQWSTGETGQQITVNNKGSYSVTAVSIDGCKSSDTLNVLTEFTLPSVKLDHNPELCEGSERVLNAGPFSKFLWQDGSSNQWFTVKGTGIYFVEVRDIHDCSGRDTVIITTLLSLPIAFLPDDTAICTYSNLLIKPSQPFKSYLWSTGSSSASITVETPGQYWLEVTDIHNCKGKDSIGVFPKECMAGLYVPTAFTPNHDGKNDVFRALFFGTYQKFELTIFNRWGEIIFQTTNPLNGWDGMYKGKPQDTNVFVWSCLYKVEGEEVKSAKGTVSLIR
jgi:gliding motility-associated-like protein